MSRSYYRAFFALKEDSRGYSAGRQPQGRCVVEARGGTGKASVYVQDLKPQVTYDVYIVKSGEKATACCLGTIESSPRLRAEERFEFDADNPGGKGCPIEDYDGVAVIVNNPQMDAPLSGGKEGPIATGWRRGVTYKATESVTAAEERRRREVPPPPPPVFEEAPPLVPAWGPEPDPNIPPAPPPPESEPKAPPTPEPCEEPKPKAPPMPEPCDEPKPVPKTPPIQEPFRKPIPDPYCEPVPAQEPCDDRQPGFRPPPLYRPHPMFGQPLDCDPVDKQSQNAEPAWEDPHLAFQTIVQRFDGELNELAEITGSDMAPEPQKNADDNLRARANEPEGIDAVFAQSAAVAPFEGEGRTQSWARISQRELALLPLDFTDYEQNTVLAAAYYKHGHYIVSKTPPGSAKPYVLGVPDANDPEDRGGFMRLGFHSFKNSPGNGYNGYWLKEL
ncbi:MAG: hypothetical protein LBS19_00410 [Clostridiales bacterium]|jgi:hypothetical protein|nr:hypothetical protein [Clostridiales bacterium]